MEAPQHIFTLSPDLPFSLVERILTAVEVVLTDGGASRIWVDPHMRDIAVIAELPVQVPQPIE